MRTPAGLAGVLVALVVLVLLHGSSHHVAAMDSGSAPDDDVTLALKRAREALEALQAPPSPSPAELNEKIAELSRLNEAAVSRRNEAQANVISEKAKQEAQSVRSASEFSKYTELLAAVKEDLRERTEAYSQARVTALANYATALFPVEKQTVTVPNVEACCGYQWISERTSWLEEQFKSRMDDVTGFNGRLKDIEQMPAVDPAEAESRKKQDSVLSVLQLSATRKRKVGEEEAKAVVTRKLADVESEYSAYKSLLARAEAERQAAISTRTLQTADAERETKEFQEEFDTASDLALDAELTANQTLKKYELLLKLQEDILDAWEMTEMMTPEMLIRGAARRSQCGGCLTKLINGVLTAADELK
eukprot:gnl/Hemi2/17243_TR5744_c0_g1_i2.p2 gnl/Hemi2/17243_TR5744_c0_g1~~gnl/Hemi2/17243_TR5744_c0_g1_i2.p2  ORF type:complete len:363 (+),score=82.57 gnl/Hemi2/17243_TR5744_c0_g1_i2:1431-2519(+)